MPSRRFESAFNMSDYAMHASKKPDYAMRKLEASLAALRAAVDEYALRPGERRSSDGDEGAVRQNGARKSVARGEAVLMRLRDRIAASLHSITSKVLGERQ